VRPEFIDNRELRMRDALTAHLDWLRETYTKPVELSIATGYFNPAGFGLLADRLERLSRMRLLLGAEPLPPAATPLRMPGDPQPDRFQANLVRKALVDTDAVLQRDRDWLPFAQDTDAALQRLLAFLQTGRIEVRRYEKAFLHGKAYVFAGDEGAIVGSSNFTAAGLTSNLELNLGRYDPTPVRKVQEWFDRLWDEAVPYDLAALYAARFEPHEPYLVFLRVLWERYGKELTEEAAGTARIRLTNFQNDGLFRARRISRQYGGVLIADGVGLGKTFLGGELLREIIEERRQRALLVTSAALRDGTWERFATTHQLFLEKISYEELASDVQLGGDRAYLSQRSNDYSLVLVDEAQAFRNPETKRAQALRRLLQGRPRKTLVLMSATPVNNSLWDLYYLLTYFVGHDAAFADLGIRSLKERFASAVGENPDDLTPAALFDILDATTVRRTRHFVKRYYPTDRVPGPDGTEIPIRFPTPHVAAVKYSLDEVVPGFFGEFATALAPEHGAPRLTLARYTPSRYRSGGAPVIGEEALAGLLRSGLLKRFESSAYAFGKTAEKMAKAHDIFLDALTRGAVLTAEGIDEWEQIDSDEALDQMVQDTGSTSTAGYDVERLRRDVILDRDLLRTFAIRAQGVARGGDPKLRALSEQLVRIVQQAREERLDEQDFRDKRKVIIFSYFADTVDWVNEYLREALAADLRFAEYRGRLAALAGGGISGTVSLAEAIFGFAPRSSEAPPGRDDDRFDILVTTDILAEGMNLQQCRNVINYDLPWNPMRLVQRHGRVDRIGSPHRDVYVRCFFPDRQLDALLGLEERIRRKLAQAAATVGVEQEVIPGAATGDVVFAETRTEIEKLRREDATLLENAGEDPSAHSGEEYRQELRKGLERYGNRIERLPGGAGSGFRGGPIKGHFFCARVGTRVLMRFVPFEEGKIVRDTLSCLRLIACREDASYDLAPELQQRAYDAWARARKDIWGEWTLATDPANLQPKIRPALRAAAAHLRRYPPAGMTQEVLTTLIEAVEAPWGARIERQIREAMVGDDQAAVSAVLATKIRDLGLQPFRAPDPLPPITEDEVRLVCWMAIDA
jgi:hypothetical protein